MKKKRKAHKKDEAYEMFLFQREQGKINIYQISKEFGIPYSTTHGWVKKWERSFARSDRGFIGRLLGSKK